MKYVVCESPGKFELREKSTPLKKEGEALLKIKKVGICGTDLHAFLGKQAYFEYPRILGHELSAEIEEIEENNLSLKKGDRVIVIPYIHCGKCFACRSGKTNCCSSLKVLGVHMDGGMQEYICISTDLLISAGNLSAEEVALVEPLAIGAHAVKRAKIAKKDFVLVVGCGPIGIGIIKMAQMNGAIVIAMDVNEKRLEFVQESIGADYIVKADDDSTKKIQYITNDEMAAVVFDATGNKKALESGAQFMSNGGQYVIVGLSQGGIVFNHPAIHAKEISILCSRNATKEDFVFVREILESGKFPTESYITHSVKIENMIADFKSWLDPSTGVIKAMVSF